MATAFRQAHLQNVGGGSANPALVLAILPVLPGSLMFARLVFDAGLVVNSMIDSNNTTVWARAKALDHGGAGAHRMELWYTTNYQIPVTNNPNIVWQLSGTCSFALGCVGEYTGAELVLANALGNTAQGNCDSACGASPIAMSTGSIAVSQGSILLVSGQVDNGTVTPPGAPWNDRATDTSFGSSILDQVNVAAGNYAGSMSNVGTANDDWDMFMVEFKAPNAAPVDTVTLAGQFQLR